MLILFEECRLLIAASSMVLLPALRKPEIKVMGGNNKDYRRNQKPNMNAVKNLLGCQQNHTQRKHQQWQDIAVMFFEAMHQRETTDYKCQKDHEIFKLAILNNVNAKNRKAADQKWENGAVDSTSY